MRVFGIPAIVLVAANAAQTDTHTMETQEADCNDGFCVSDFNQVSTRTEFAPLAAYEMGKKVLDGVCMIWESRQKIMRALRNGTRAMKKAARLITGGMNTAMRALDQSKAMKNAARKAFKFMKSNKLVKNFGRNARRAAEQAKRRLQQARRRAQQAAAAVRRRAQQAARRARQAAAAVRRRASAAARRARSWAKRAWHHRWHWAQVSESQRQPELAELQEMLQLPRLDGKVKKVVMILIKVLMKSPWADKIEAAQTIVKFINDVSHHRRIKGEQAMNVGCALNEFLPSTKQLGKFMLSGKTMKKRIRNSIKNVNYKALRRQAKKEAKKAYKRLKKEIKKEGKKAIKDAFNTKKEELKRRGSVHWRRIGGGLRYVAVANNGKTWGINRYHQIYFRNGVNGHWRNIGGRLKQVSVAGNGNYVWGVNRNDDIFFRAGEYRGWQHIGGKLKQVAVCGNYGQQVWGVNSGDYIYQRGGLHGRWRNIGGRLKQVACGGAHGNHVWGINSNNDIFYRHGVNAPWRHVPGKLKQISVSGNHGQHVWGVNRYNHIYYRNGYHGGWQRIGGGLQQINVGGSNGQFLWGTYGSAIYYSGTQ